MFGKNIAGKTEFITVVMPRNFHLGGKGRISIFQDNGDIITGTVRRRKQISDRDEMLIIEGECLHNKEFVFDEEQMRLLIVDRG